MHGKDGECKSMQTVRYIYYVYTSESRSRDVACKPGCIVNVHESMRSECM